MIAESKEKNRQRLQLAKDKIRLDELEQNAKLRIMSKEQEFNQKWAVIQTVQDDNPIEEVPTISMQANQPKTAVTVATLAENRQKAMETKQRNIKERRDRARQIMADNPQVARAGEIDRLLVQELGVSLSTAKNDRLAIQKVVK